MSLANVAYRMATEETFFQAVQRWMKTGGQSDLESLTSEDRSALKGLFARGVRFEQLLDGYGDAPAQDIIWWRP